MEIFVRNNAKNNTMVAYDTNRVDRQSNYLPDETTHEDLYLGYEAGSLPRKEPRTNANDNWKEIIATAFISSALTAAIVIMGYGFISKNPMVIEKTKIEWRYK